MVSRPTPLRWLALGSFVVGLSPACGSSDAGGGANAAGGPGQTGGGCCNVNTATYQCPDAASLAKCGASNPDPSGCAHVMSCSGNNTSSNTFCCGLNSSYYDCPSQDAVLACTQSDPSKCTSRSMPCPNP